MTHVSSLLKKVLTKDLAFIGLSLAAVGLAYWSTLNPRVGVVPALIYLLSWVTVFVLDAAWIWQAMCFISYLISWTLLIWAGLGFVKNRRRKPSYAAKEPVLHLTFIGLAFGLLGLILSGSF